MLYILTWPQMLLVVKTEVSSENHLRPFEQFDVASMNIEVLTRIKVYIYIK